MKVNSRLNDEYGKSDGIEAKGLITLGHNAKGNYCFIKGKRNVIVPLFAWGFKNWPAFISFNNYQKGKANDVFKRIPTDKKEIFYVSKELMTDAYVTGAEDTMSILIKDIGENKYELEIKNMDAAISFVRSADNQNMIAYHGYGSEKRGLTFYGAGILFGDKIKKKLQDSIYVTKDEVDTTGIMGQLHGTACSQLSDRGILSDAKLIEEELARIKSYTDPSRN